MPTALSTAAISSALVLDEAYIYTCGNGKLLLRQKLYAIDDDEAIRFLPVNKPEQCIEDQIQPHFAAIVNL